MRGPKIALSSATTSTAEPASSSKAQTHELIPEEHAGTRRYGVLWLIATIALVGPVRVAGPGVGLDPGWASALGIGHQAGMRFGRDLLFVYGPWGFLDVPLATSRPDFALGLGFSVASVVAAWLLAVTVLRSQVSPKMALLAGSVLTLTLASVSPPSFLLTAVGAVACVCHLRRIPKFDTAWLPFAVSGLAALLLQIKFPEGVALTALALITSLASSRSRLTRTAASMLLWAVTSLVLWAAADQTISDVGPWWHASTDFLSGYTGAMSLGLGANTISTVFYAMSLLLIVSIGVLGWRRCADQSLLSHLGAVVVTVGTMFFGFKQSFTRHDVQHNSAFFVIVALLLCALMHRGPSRRATALLIVLSSLLASPAVFTQVRATPAEAWGRTWRIFTSDASWAAVLKQAHDEDQAEYALPKEMVKATAGHAVSVDPWEVSLVWAYSMKWRPMPVFQSYSAYTTYLDEANAEAARRAGSDQMLIRATTISTKDRPTSIDDRNPLWESPRYTLAAVCNYRMVTADKRWLLLRKSVNRCGDSSSVKVIHDLAAGQSVQVPRGGPAQIITASFVPRKPSPLRSLATLLFRDPEPLHASVNGHSFRVPETMSAGPLLATLPTTSGWPGEFRGDVPVRSLAFSRPGTLQFRTIHLVP
jgi:hypothetical protein